MPVRRSRRHMPPFEVVVLVAGATFHSREAVSVRATSHTHGVPVAIITLARKISLGMAIHTARMTQYRDHGFKGASGCSIIPLCRPRNGLTLCIFIVRGDTSWRTERHGARHNDSGEDYRISPLAHYLNHPSCSPWWLQYSVKRLPADARDKPFMRSLSFCSVSLQDEQLLLVPP
jgi:hypothetical protein